MYGLSEGAVTSWTKSCKKKIFDTNSCIQSSELYGSLVSLVYSQRETFKDYKEKVLRKVEHKNNQVEEFINKRKTVHSDESRDEQVELSASNNFKINAFYPIIDMLTAD